METSLVTDIVTAVESGPLPNPESRARLRSKIAELEQFLATHEQIEIPTKHSFSKGVYAREITIPKGAIIVGKIHKHQNMNIISKGHVSFFSTDGAVHAKAPYTFVASPGVKRVIVAHEETVWTTIHGTDETDLEAIEEIFIAKNYDDLYLSSGRTLDDVLSIIGASHEYLKAISENEDDLTDFPLEYGVEVRFSRIHGQGLFATTSYVAGELICPARIGGKRTPAGRYTNHYHNPNAEMVTNNLGDVELYALRDIPAGSEIVTDYYFNFKNTRSQLCHGL